MLWQWKPQLYPFVDASHWTIPIQLVAFTAVLAACRRPVLRRVPAVALLWGALAFEVALWPERVYGGSEAFRMFYDAFGWYRMHLFAAGVGVYLLASGRIGRAHGAVLLAASLAVHELQVRDVPTTLALTAGLLVTVAAAVGPDWGPAVPAAVRPAIRWLAGISYGIYLTHQSLGDIAMRHMQDAGFGAGAQTLGMFAVGILSGWLLTVAVERPAYRGLCRLRDRVASGGRSWQGGRVTAPPAGAGPDGGPPRGRRGDSAKAREAVAGTSGRVVASGGFAGAGPAGIPAARVPVESDRPARPGGVEAAEVFTVAGVSEAAEVSGGRRVPQARGAAGPR
jgi:peptidoglycan/LPS O-acetylase OafA/YrhL